jgi:proteic killer suppression protein
MEINYKTKKLAKLLNSSKLIEKYYGRVMAKKIHLRLKTIKFAKNLKEVMKLPGRHHALTGDRKGQFACDLEHPYRLIYEPDNDPLPFDENNMLIYSKVTIVEIIEITDYH